MIDKCKFAMKFLCRLVVGAGRFMWRFEITEKDIFPVQHNPCSVEGVTFVPTHSLESSQIIGVHPDISMVLSVVAFSKIAFAIIQSIVITMVSKVVPFPEVKYDSVHTYHSAIFLFLVPYICAGVKTLGCLVPRSMPSVLRQLLDILSIHDSVLALRESNEPVGWIERLGNRVPWQSLSGHILTSNESVFLSRYFSTAGA